ncbi:MAG: hypothetical protein Q8O09_02145, partial [Bacillota bacterium]|nr:hypothetical protein [Bacillota bacterium]
MKKIIPLIISVLLIAGCSAPAATAPSASEPTVASLLPSPSPSPSQTPVDPMVEKLALAPDIEGLAKEIREKDGIQ